MMQVSVSVQLSQEDAREISTQLQLCANWCSTDWLQKL